MPQATPLSLDDLLAASAPEAARPCLQSPR